MSKFEIAISTLLIGFVLGQAVDFIKYRWSIYRKKKAISDEIQDISKDFKTKAKRIEKILNETNNVEVCGTMTPSAISSVIFKHHYADVAPFFTREQRAELTIIYQCVDNFNEELSKGGRNSLASSNNSMLSLYSQCLMGVSTIEYYLVHKGRKCIADNKNEMEKNWGRIQALADKYHI
ncbi:hypothetical protein L1D40_10250 [Shewanella insulae]|uniref:hypothetical protein n=1 Tax=Shewanella insulae TaxID=2681496 RepID=UPI001EFDAF89|nr:hypothetical protein [Shewanella insulae]MCG9714167.1 hypothetical protein [Shewanella insulae]MCG9755595.1 hypothetical protein [Shewanella insulae]